MTEKELDELRYYFDGYGSRHEEAILKLIEQNRRYYKLLESISDTQNIAKEIWGEQPGKKIIGPDDLLQHILRKVNKELEERE